MSSSSEKLPTKQILQIWCSKRQLKPVYEFTSSSEGQAIARSFSCELTIDTVSFVANGVGLTKKAAASEAALAMLAWLVNNEPDHLHHLSFEELSLRGYERLNARQLLFLDDGRVPILLDCVTTGRSHANENSSQKRKTTEPSLDKEVLNNEHLPSKKKPKEKKKDEVGDNFVNLFPIPLSTDDDDNCDLLVPPPKSKSKAAQRFQKFKKSKLNRSPFPPSPAPNPNPNLEMVTTPGDVSNLSELSPTDAAAPSLKRTSEVDGGVTSSPLKSPAAKRKKSRRRADPKNGAFAYSPSHSSSSSSLSMVSNLVANLSLDDPTLYLSPPSHPPESLVRILPADHTFNPDDDGGEPLFLRAVCHDELCRHPDHLDPGKHQKHQVLLAERQASSKTLVKLLGSS